MRKMARVVIIDAVTPHMNADRLELAKIGAWQSVVGKGEFKAGDWAVYCEIDAFVPHELAPTLTKNEAPSHEVGGVKGNVLKTMTLRGELSQGYLIPMTRALQYWSAGPQDNGEEAMELFYPEADVSNLLGISKYEKPLTEEQKAFSLGFFPSAFPKTDEERVQNLERKLLEYAREGLTFEVTEKLEGESMTAFQLDGQFGVCSRTHQLRLDPVSGKSPKQVELALKQNLAKLFSEKLAGRNIALQGEIIGPGIEGNIYRLEATHFRVYKVVEEGHVHLTPQARRELLDLLELPGVPVMQTHFKLPLENIVPTLLEMAKGVTCVGNNSKQRREGLVFKCNERPEISFKAINNEYLLKG